MSPETDIDTLTPREKETYGYTIHGFAPKYIAFNMGITERTVRVHLNSIYHKLGIFPGSAYKLTRPLVYDPYPNHNIHVLLDPLLWTVTKLSAYGHTREEISTITLWREATVRFHRNSAGHRVREALDTAGITFEHDLQPSLRRLLVLGEFYGRNPIVPVRTEYLSDLDH